MCRMCDGVTSPPQTIFQVLPQITGVIEEEWLHVLKGFKACGAVWERGVAPLSLESSNQVLIDLTRTCVERTSLVDTGEEVSYVLGRRWVIMYSEEVRGRGLNLV